MTIAFKIEQKLTDALDFVKSKTTEEIKLAYAVNQQYITGAMRWNGSQVSPTEMGHWSENPIAQVILHDSHYENIAEALDEAESEYVTEKGLTPKMEKLAFEIEELILNAK